MCLFFGEYRDFTQKYHNSKAHTVCSLISNMGLISVDIGALKPGKYGLRVEGIIDPKDDESRFDIDTRTFTTPKMITRTRYKAKIDPHAVAMDMEIEVTNEVRNCIFGIDIEHVPNNEIALFIFGRRGEGHVDPQISDNINYYEKIKIPRYRSFEVNADRRRVRVFKDAHDDSFTWNGKEFEVEMDENVGRVFRLQFASGRLYARPSSNKIYPISFTLKEA